MKRVRNVIYNMSLEFGLFSYLPAVMRLPKPLSTLLLKLKAGIRFYRGTYRAYINRENLKAHAISNLITALKTDKAEASRKIYRLMQSEVMAERNGLLLDSYTIKALEDQFTIHNLTFLEKELTKGKGVIFTTIHSGDTLLFMLLLSLNGYNIYGLFDKGVQHKKPLNPLEKFARLKDEKIDGRIGKLYAGRGMLGLFDALRENAIIVWMVDLPAYDTKRRSQVHFLDQDIIISKSFWDVAAKAGCSIVPHITIYDLDNDRHTVHIGSPLDVENNTIQDIYSFFEPHVRAHPESWIGWYVFDQLSADA
jgi:lauroyl/myristoyl acyltransferase